MTRLTPREVSLLTLQLATMLAAGVPLVAALEGLGRMGSPAVEETMGKVVGRLLGGSRLSAALDQFPQSFSSEYVALIRVGEGTGGLVHVLRELSRSLVEAERRRARLLASLAYPLFILGVCCLLVAGLLWFLVPQMLKVVPAGPVPGPTRWMMGLVSTPILPLLLVGGLASAVLIARQARTPAGRLGLEWLIYGLPGLSAHLQNDLWARQARSLALMLKSGMLPTQALPLLLHPTTGYSRADEALRHISHEFREDGQLARAFERQEAVPRLLVKLLHVGESTGRLDFFLDQYANLLEMQLDYEREAFLSLLEPVLLGMLGLVVGFVVMAAWLPVYQLVLAP